MQYIEKITMVSRKRQPPKKIVSNSESIQRIVSKKMLSFELLPLFDRIELVEALWESILDCDTSPLVAYRI